MMNHEAYINSKRFFLLAIIILLSTLNLYGQTQGVVKSQLVSEKKDTTIVTFSDTVRKIQNQAFGPGEFFRFDVNYGFVTAGEATLFVRDTIYNNRRCHLVEFNLNSKPFFDAFYKVRDRYITIIDAEGLFPWRFEQHIREGGYSRDFTAEFDQINHTAVTTNGKYPIPGYVQDMMSAFYFTRVLDFSKFKPGDKLHLQNFYKDSTYELDVKYKGTQVIDVEAGEFNCIIVEPLAREGGLFKNEGKLYVWMTNDERRIPVLVTAKILIGKVESELIEYRGLLGPLKSKLP
ncbi:MAG: DUF3108 domain-containing protein [Ignavibacteriales bacterium]|nr:DUF3108 domain-containing protein [Ignavibacteriales bacterium]